MNQEKKEVLLEKITWKFFLTEGEKKVTSENMFRVFNEWIPESPEIFVDPADYFHVSDGVKCILAGHYVHFYWEDSDHKQGLMYSRVKPFEEASNQERLKSSLKNAITRMLDLQNAIPEFKFASDQIQFGIRERFIAKNDDKSCQQWLEELEPFIKNHLSDFSYSTPADPRRLFQMDLQLKTKVDWEKMKETLV